MSDNLIEEIFLISDEIRYVAVYCGGELVSSTKPGLAGASSSESDKYEELIVNPTILTLAHQRGNIDCGGCKFVLIRYGNFYQLLRSIRNGHISICLSLAANPLSLFEQIEDVIQHLGYA